MMMGMKKGKTMMSSGKMETSESTRVQRIRSRDRQGQIAAAHGRQMLGML